MPLTEPTAAAPWSDRLDALRCVGCGGGLALGADALTCAACRRSYPVRDDVLVVREQVTDNNRVAQDFYNGPLWPKFRFWEWFFFVTNGGERRSRQKILRHLPTAPGLKLLDVAVGDGVYLDWLPRDWDVTGIDVSAAQLANCRRRAAVSGRPVRLVLGEAEDLPFRDRSFDAALSIGGLNHFNDPEGALREMARVVRPGGEIVAADEAPDLTGWMVGHLTGIPALVRLDNWFVARVMHLGPEFTDLVERNRHLDIAAIGARTLADSRFEWIWRKGGYVLAGEAP
jgi:ubiquinone/menaquinone biosynthesis C-methylase UbiE